MLRHAVAPVTSAHTNGTLERDPHTVGGWLATLRQVGPAGLDFEHTGGCAATSVTFLQQPRAQHPEPLIVIWDNGPAHGGDPLRPT
jgi:hypothetical protein